MAPSPADIVARTVTQTVTHFVRAAASTTSSTATSTSTAAASAGRPASYKIVGIILAVCSGLFIGISFVLKKVGLLKANVKYNQEAGEGYGYLKNAYWWGGMTLMIVGEICNFVAYAFTDAILVTPLGALSVVITTILSAIFLKERLSFVGKVGCFLCIVGSVIIPLNAPEQSAVANIQEMQHFFITPGFLVYAGVILAGCAFIALWAGPRYGKKSMLVYLSICSLIGGLSVVSTQGLGSAIVAQINGEPQFNKWFLYVLFVFVIGTLVTEIIYLNKALNLFNAALVTPTYYVYFTSSTIVASTVLFQGLHGTAFQIIDIILGFLVICSGVVLLQLAKSAKDVPDTAVFKGDLDQMRTVAEQEEPEYEPRADTIRGGAGIVRAISRVRTKRQVDEVKRIRDERLSSVGEGEEFEWDGLRRRKTVSSAGGGGAGSLRRSKTVHPPLGMSRMPNEDHDDGVSEPDSEVHPGFFGRIGRKSHTSIGSASRRPQHDSAPVPLTTVHPPDKDGASPDEHIYGLPPGLRNSIREEEREDDGDIAYKGAGANPHIHFANAGSDSRERADSRGSSLAPPRPPPHTASGRDSQGNRRQFSFNNVFGRARARGDSAATAEADDRPVSRGALSFASRASRVEYPAGAPGATTEEERAGLVQGDGSMGSLPRYEDVAADRRRSGQGRTGGYDDVSEEDEELYGEPLRGSLTERSTREGGGGGAFM